MEIDQSSLKEHIAAYFMNLYRESGIGKPKLDGISFQRILANMRNWVELLFDEEEVKKVAWSIEDDKASGFDGFTMAFFKQCWDVVKMDIMDTMNNFHEEVFLDLGSNVTFISLIPKAQDACRISKFRPISLVGSIYKILSKNLSCRLKRH